MSLLCIFNATSPRIRSNNFGSQSLVLEETGHKSRDKPIRRTLSHQLTTHVLSRADPTYGIFSSTRTLTFVSISTAQREHESPSIGGDELTASDSVRYFPPGSLFVGSASLFKRVQVPSEFSRITLESHNQSTITIDRGAVCEGRESLEKDV
jgi:hypothetical protein